MLPYKGSFLRMTLTPKVRERSKSLPQNCQPLQYGAGVTCSNQDLQSILSSNECLTSATEVCRRKSEIVGFFNGFSNRSARRPLPNRSISLVTWNEDVQVDPLLIGSSIEEYIAGNTQRGDSLEELKKTPDSDNPKTKLPPHADRNVPLTISIHRKKMPTQN